MKPQLAPARHQISTSCTVQTAMHRGSITATTDIVSVLCQEHGLNNQSKCFNDKYEKENQRFNQYYPGYTKR